VRARHATLATLIAVAVTLTACSADQTDAVDDAAKRFLDAWSAGKLDAAGAATDAPNGPPQWLPLVHKQLGTEKVSFKLGEGTTDDKAATRDVTVSWTIPGQEKPWSYPSKLELVKRGEDWKVHWETTVVHPELGPTQKFAVERTLPERAPILDTAGQPLFSKQQVVTVGIEPGKATDLDGLAATLAGILAAEKVTAAEIVADARKAKPTAFVPVVTLRQARYLAVKPQIYSLPGTVFQQSERLLPITPTFGQPLLGKVGEATAEVLKEAGDVYAAGDQLGTSGLQRTYNKQLAGVPSVVISLADPTGKPVKELASFAGSAGTPLTTTLDRTVQTAAEQALTSVPQQAAIVAIRPGTGEILAVANSANVDFNIALEGKYPPGSTFKIVTMAAILQSGISPTSSAPCPGQVTVGGKRFTNADSFDLGTVPLRTAFARSCNTTMINLAGKLPADKLASTAAQYGIGQEWRLGVPAYGGAVPPAADATEAAADAIGQGKVLVSPLSMALAAGTMKVGSLPSPSLIEGKKASPTVPVKASTGVDVVLQGFARAVVTEGTAKAALGNARGEVAGKTGTAEYGDATPPRSHSWFAGYRGDLAFAVFVYDGASSGKIAAPIAATFLAKVR
jgi:cell division protein FtsI/penicillin-binding protein 2